MKFLVELEGKFFGGKVDSRQKRVENSNVEREAFVAESRRGIIRARFSPFHRRNRAFVRFVVP